MQNFKISKRLFIPGLIKEKIKEKGLTISGRSLDYYLNNLESRGLIELNFVKKNKGRTRKIRIPNESILS